MKEFGLIPHRSIHWPLVVMLPAFCPQIAPIMPVLPVVPTHKYCAVYYLRFELFHGMEEVIGSIPIRSTKTSSLESETYRADPSDKRVRIGTEKALMNNSVDPRLQSTEI